MYHKGPVTLRQWDRLFFPRKRDVFQFCYLQGLYGRITGSVNDYWLVDDMDGVLWIFEINLTCMRGNAISYNYLGPKIYPFMLLE